MQASSKARRVSARRKSASAAANSLSTITRPELLVDGRDDDFRQMVHGLFALRSLLQLIVVRHGRMLGLGSAEYMMLMMLNRLPPKSAIGVQALADRLHLSSAFIALRVNSLVRKKLLEKVINPSDKRRVVLSITEKGRQSLRRLLPVQREINDIAFGFLTAADFKLLRGVIDQLVRSTERAIAVQRFNSKAEEEFF